MGKAQKIDLESTSCLNPILQAPILTMNECCFALLEFSKGRHYLMKQLLTDCCFSLDEIDAICPKADFGLISLLMSEYMSYHQ